MEQKLLDILGELSCAVGQSLPSDDQIIMEHVRTAERKVRELLHEVMSENDHAIQHNESLTRSYLEDRGRL